MNLTQLQHKTDNGEKIAVLTCYDASFAAICEQAGVDVLLVGDSLGMTLQGATSTLGVTLHEMQYHTRCVAAGSRNAYIVADLPFGSYQQNREQALRNAARLMAAGEVTTGPVPTGAEYAPPMANVEQGMTPRQVKRLLGNPGKTLIDKEHRGMYSGGVVNLGRPRLSELRLLFRRQRRVPVWIFEDTPQAGLKTVVRFRQGQVAIVDIVPL